MEKREELYRGKAKSVYKTDDENRLILLFRNDTSAFDGKRLAQLDVIFKGDEFVQCSNNNWRGHRVSLQVATLAKGEPGAKKTRRLSGALRILAKSRCITPTQCPPPAQVGDAGAVPIFAHSSGVYVCRASAWNSPIRSPRVA